MNKEQIQLLNDTLSDALCSRDCKIDFPTTICDIIDAKIAYYQAEHIDLIMESSEEIKSRYLKTYKNRVARLQELKTIMDGK